MNRISICIRYFLLLITVACSEFKDPAPNYTYQIPTAPHELETSSLESEGMNEEVITQMTNLILQQEYKRIDAVLILKNNRLVYEQYFQGHSQTVPHNIYSATKSITSILTGIAIDKGFLPSIDTPILSLLPEYTPLQNPDPRKNQITLQHLLNMSSGLECEDWYSGTEAKMRQSQDWVKFTLDLPMVNTPGLQGSYCTGNVVVLGRIIENQTNMSLNEFAYSYLFEPLGIKEYKWNTIAGGRFSGGGGELFLRPRDMAKIGLLMLNKGNWEGKQIVSQQWVQQSGENILKLSGPFSGYGYLWWKQVFLRGNAPIEVYFASGNGGQEIFVIPAKEMVVVFTTGNVNTSLGLQNIYMMRDYILPSIE